MSDLLPVSSRRPFLTSRAERAVERSMNEIDSRARVLMRSDALRIERVAEKAERGLVAAAQIAAVEAALVPMLPHADRRFQQIAEAGSLGIARIVMER